MVRSLMSTDVKGISKSGSERKSYARPALREFGQVGKLTQAGTGMSAEGQGNQMNDPNRRI